MKKSPLVIISLIIVFVIIFSSLSIIKAVATSDLTTSLKNSLIPIETTKPGNGYKDLELLRKILEDKKIIAMGDATHGTKEFFEMKHRIIEFLVEEMGFRVFAIEAEFGGAQIVNDYILNGKGTLREAIWALDFWVWSTEEIADMLEWMKKYNENPINEKKIRFYGFDIQRIENNLECFLQYLKKFDGDISSTLEEFVSDFQSKSNRFITYSNKQLIGDLSEEIYIIRNLFEVNKEKYIVESSKAEYEINLQHLNIITQFIEFNESLINEEFNQSFNIRDYHMAKNVNWILNYETQNYENNKVILWAHNGHVAKKYGNYISMGEHLSKIFDDKYYGLAFCFYKGGFRALMADEEGKPISRDIANFSIKPSINETFAQELEKTEVNLGYLDFKEASKDANILEFLSKEQSMYNIGVGYGGRKSLSSYLLNSVPMESFDGIIFIKETTPAIGINRYITKIEDGDKLLEDENKFVMVGGIASSLGIIASIVYLIRIFKKKMINKKRPNDRKLN